MKKILLLIICLFLTSCYFDIKKDPKYAEDAIGLWFNYKNKDDDLGKTRRRLQGIDNIVSSTCVYKENDKYSNYIYRCKIIYKPINETVIPLAKDKEIDVMVALSFKNDYTYTYTVYNSSMAENEYLNDKQLNYNNRYGGNND